MQTDFNKWLNDTDKSRNPANIYFDIFFLFVIFTYFIFLFIYFSTALTKRQEQDFVSE